MAARASFYRGSSKVPPRTLHRKPVRSGWRADCRGQLMTSVSGEGPADKDEETATRNRRKIKMPSGPENESVLIFDFGAQYCQLIARRVREQNVFCQIVRHDLPAARVSELKPHGLILSGGPSSVYEKGAP